MKTRTPMTFDVDRSPPTPTELAAKSTPTPQRKQVGARISAATYRQLKSRAALDGVTVQTLVEKAVEQFLATG